MRTTFTRAFVGSDQRRYFRGHRQHEHRRSAARRDAADNRTARHLKRPRPRPRQYVCCNFIRRGFDFVDAPKHDRSGRAPPAVAEACIIADSLRGKMAVSRKVEPPDSLANIPRIYLNTSERDQVCLLSAARLDAAASCSLPNLSSAVGADRRGSRRHNDVSGRRTRHASVGGGKESAGRRAPDAVYATPKFARRGCNSRGDQCRVAVDWLTDRRRHSDSSSDSGGHLSMMSISNLSMCATSDYTHLTSWDKLSMFSASTDALEWAPGKLRRIYSNPDNAALAGDADARATGSGSVLSDSHSCSNLRKQTMLDEMYDPSPRMLSPSAAQHPVHLRAQPEIGLSLTPDESGHRRALYSPTEDVVLNRDSKVRKWLDALNT